uniref:Uncharacterized protein n=1 Tax=Kalanchoe fedtschenkoi TaxID=63787 RepID=A0A7N0V0K9_KALFE
MSQASIGESKKGKNESVPVYGKVGEQKLVIGTLSAYKHPQIQYDVKNGSIFGYRTQNPGDDEGFSGDEFDSDSKDEELPIKNGKSELVHVAAAKPATTDKAKVSVQEAAKEAKADSDPDLFFCYLLCLKENKKRPTEPENKTLVSSKKVKIATPQKTAGKIPKSENPKTPATVGKSIITCGSCSKTFNSDKGQGSRVSLQG